MRNEVDVEAQSGGGAGGAHVELQLLLRTSAERGRGRTQSPTSPSHQPANRNGGLRQAGRELNITLPPHRDSPPSSASSTPTPSPYRSAPFSRRRSDRRLRRLNTELLEAIEAEDLQRAEKSLNDGANPNATCRLDLVSACHIAAAMGEDQILALLINRGAERSRMDRLGRTPLHLAAWGGHNKCVAILLHFPESLQSQLDGEMTQQTESSVRYCCSQLRNNLVNVQCVTMAVRAPLPKEWKDSFDHECKEIKDVFPLIGVGWTPLHVAAAAARPDSARLLLVAGAEVQALDERGRTPLDVLGITYYNDPEEVTAEDFLTVLKMLLEAGAPQKTMRYGGVGEPASPLHTAVELESCEAIQALLDDGAYAGVFNDDGDTPLHTCVKRQFEEPLQVLVNTLSADEEPFQQNVDLRNASGYTALQAAVIDEWIPGVCAALEAGADVGVQAYDGDTAIHAAAALGNAELLQEVLSVVRTEETIDCPNSSGETALFKAISNGNLECVKILINECASLTKTMPGGVTVIHRAAEFGFADILKVLLIEHKKNTNTSMINALCDEKRQGFGAIHYAALNDRAECVKVLLENGADVRLRTTANPHAELTALHVAAMLGHTSVVNAILAFDKTTVQEMDGHGWLPIHTASHHGSRETIPLLLQAGADLSSATDSLTSNNRTAIDIMINNFTRPTEYLEQLFDSYISVNELGLQDSNCEVQVDYSVLMPKNCEIEQMQVIVALIKTGNRYGQRKLLLHPLVESFLYLKWRALSPFFYAILIMYVAFTISLTNLVLAIFFYEDTKDNPPAWLDVDMWSYIMLSIIVIISLKKLLYVIHNPIGHVMLSETWVTTGSVVLAATLPFIHQYSVWPRHVATFAILLSWTHLMFLLSRFPKWGYYVLMFSKVAVTVTKIMLTFGFLVVGFSLAFMIQFHSSPPFDGPLSALIKTVVMMTSEFEYEAQFDEDLKHINHFSLLMVRLIFMTFVILASIVLMNLMVGVAVNDINDLETLGHIERLAKQVEFLGTLDSFVYNWLFTKIFPKRFSRHIRGKRNVDIRLNIYPGRARWMHKHKIIPKKIKDAIFLKATTKKMIDDEAVAMKSFSKQIDEIHEATVKSRDPVDRRGKRERDRSGTDDDMLQIIESLNSGVAEAQSKVSEMSESARSPARDLKKKLDCIHKEIDQFKRMFSTSHRVRTLSEGPMTIR